MKSLLKLTAKGWMLALLVVMLVANLAVALAQPEGGTPAAQGFPPVVYYGALILGMLAHWGKGYSRGTIAGGMGAYLVSNIGLTITAFVAALGQFALIWSTNPGALTPISLVGIYNVFLVGYATDSAINGEGAFIKK